MATTNLQKMVQSLQIPVYRSMFEKSLSNDFTPCYSSKEYLAGSFKENEKTIICRLRDSYCCNCEEYRGQDSKERYCSHMFRLAVEFEFVDENGCLVYLPTKPNTYQENSEQAFCDIVNGFETTIPSETQLKFTEYNFLYKIISYINGKSAIPFAVQKTEISPFIEIDMFEICNESNIGILLDGYPFDIVSHLDELGFAWPQNLPKTKKGTYSVKAKRNWCLENIDDAVTAAGNSINVVMVRPTQKLCSAFELFCEYIKRKYCDDTTTEKFGRYTLRHPYGALVTNYRLGTYMFPDDIVTKQLDKYNCNRCISKIPGNTDLIIPSLQAKHSGNSTFSIRIPQRSDYEKMIPYITPLLEFYEKSYPYPSVKSFLDIVHHLENTDKLINELAEADGVVATSAFRSFVSKCIKEESQIKADFETVVIRLDDNRVIIGYESIVNTGIQSDKIQSVVFNSNKKCSS